MKWESYWTIISLRRNNAYDPKPGYAPHRQYPIKSDLSPFDEDELGPWSRYINIMIERRKLTVRKSPSILSTRFKKVFR